MLGFLKKLFGFDAQTMKDANVQIEQAPYKIEPPVQATATTPIPLVVEKVEVKEVEPVAPVEEKKPAAMTANKKPRGPKKPQSPKPAAKPAAPKRGRKPKAK